jgi:hypothetical protein
MFRIVSNPFVEMAQGAVSNGLGYIAERGEESKDFSWFWWIVTGILTLIGVVLISNYHDKIHQKKLYEEQERQKTIKSQKEITS